jgi:thiol-disulfide isomerase/thioredoxin
MKKICDDRPMSAENTAPENSLLVACLCAEWCGVCREYRERFAQVQSLFPQAQFVWIDVEDEADLIHPLDVENFPTLLLALDTKARFFGTLTPQAQTLERMLRAQLDDSHAAALNDPAVAALVARIRAEKFG